MVGALAVVGALALPVLGLVGCTGRAPDLSGPPTVTRVVDGDTVVVRLGGRDETIRLLGVDTPETVHPTRPEECFGREAAGFTAGLLPPGTPLRLERDVEERDHYGRLLAYVHREDGRFVNQELVAGGYAATLVIAPNHAHADALRSAEHEARSAGHGLWARCGGPGVPLG